MGIYNGIHSVDDDHYYYCPDGNCTCHGPVHYDCSANNDCCGGDDHIND
jgi:hypothetical protein